MKEACHEKKGGIHDMYPQNDWFFLHCSPDGPWCKPCAERNLVYNAKCGQCEATREGPCTGPAGLYCVFSAFNAMLLYCCFFFNFCSVNF